MTDPSRPADRPDHPPRPVLVIGFGNPLRGDDGLGQVVAARLRALVPPAQAHILTPQQLTLDLAEPVSQADLVLLIDAARGAAPGTIACQTISAEREAPPSLLHHITPGMLLAGTQALFGAAPRMLLWTIGADAYAVGADLSPAAARAVDELTARLVALIREQAASE